MKFGVARQISSLSVLFVDFFPTPLREMFVNIAKKNDEFDGTLLNVIKLAKQHSRTATKTVNDILLKF